MASGDWKKNWEKAKKSFEKVTSKKKPNATIIGFVKGRKSGVGNKLGTAASKFQELEIAFADPKKIPNAMKAFEKAVVDAQKECASYMNDLSSAILKAVGKKGDEWQIYAQQVRLLQRELDTITSEMTSELKVRKVIAARGVKGMMEFNSLLTVLRPTVKRAQVWSKRLASSPDVAKFNQEVNEITRNITQSTNNIMKMYKKANKNKLYSELAICAIPLTAWADKGRTITKKGAGAKEVSDELKMIDASLNKLTRWMKNPQPA